jgi:hypothetical protein
MHLELDGIRIGYIRPVVHRAPCLEWEGKTVARCLRNPLAISVQGEFESFVYLRGVGTHWKLGPHEAIVFSRRILFRRLIRAVLLWLNPSVNTRRWERQDRCRTAEILSSPLPPLALQRQTLRSVRPIIRDNEAELSNDHLKIGLASSGSTRPTLTPSCCTLLAEYFFRLMDRDTTNQDRHS